MRKYLLHILIISFVFLLVPTACINRKVEEHFNLGNAYYESGKWKEAIESYKQAIRIDPDFAEAHHDLGVAYGELGKHEEAIKSFKQAIRIDPDYAEAHRNLGTVYSESGMYKKAIEFKETV
jgi:tetratricopeptide (TPR) repeat protein